MCIEDTEHKIAKQAIGIACHRIARSLQTHDERTIEQAREVLSRSATCDRHKREYALSNAQRF